MWGPLAQVALGAGRRKSLMSVTLETLLLIRSSWKTRRRERNSDISDLLRSPEKLSVKMETFHLLRSPFKLGHRTFADVGDFGTIPLAQVAAKAGRREHLIDVNDQNL